MVSILNIPNCSFRAFKRKSGRKSIEQKVMTVPPVCGFCNKNRVARSNVKGKTYWRKYCHTCADARYKDVDKKRETDRLSSAKSYQKFQQTKMKPCAICGFMPEASCQMDIDHINDNHWDNRPENRQLLCANCHRLKSLKNKDYGGFKYITH